MPNPSYKNKIVAFYKRTRRMPSYREIMDLVGFRSTNAVAKLVANLEKEGFLDKDAHGKLIPRNFFGEVKMLGLVEAGFPSAAEEEIADTMNLDEYLIERKEASFILKVKGDSMIDAGIQEGDMVIVERGATPREGDIVIALVDGGYTMKYYHRKGTKVWLEPANKNYPTITPTESLSIAAVVKAVIRKY